MKVAEGVYSITCPTPFAVGPVNIYIVIENDRIMMVDAGPKTDEAWIDFQKELLQIGLTPDDIDIIVLTHHHPDHTGLINYFSKDIPIYGHQRLTPWLRHDPVFAERYNTYFKKLAVTMGVPEKFLNYLPAIDDYLKYGGKGELAKTIDEGDVVPYFEDWKVVYTPGHAGSHISLLRHDGCMIAGDVLLENISSNAILEPPYHDYEAAPHTLLLYRDSLKKSLGLGIKKVLPGHGGAYDFTERFILERLNEQEQRREHIFHLIGDGKQTVIDIGMTMFKGAWQRQLDLVLSEVQGYIDWLLLEEKIEMDVRQGTYTYRKKEA